MNSLPTMAETVGGVSATASPIANSSGSVTNQAIQVLQGPYITNTYGGGIQCQGPTMNVTPFVTGNVTWKKPFERYYDDPVYDVHDADDDGQIDNPGNILYYMPTRTNQTDNYNLSIGVSATWSRPLDKDLQELCKNAATTQINMQQQFLYKVFVVPYLMVSTKLQKHLLINYIHLVVLFLLGHSKVCFRDYQSGRHHWHHERRTLDRDTCVQTAA